MPSHHPAKILSQTENKSVLNHPIQASKNLRQKVEAPAQTTILLVFHSLNKGAIVFSEHYSSCPQLVF
jgi:hypothetical protein